MVTLERPPAPSSRLEFLECIACGQKLRYLVVTTPEGLPDFVYRQSPNMWFGWSEHEDKVELVATCNGNCLRTYLDARMKECPP